MKNYIEDYQPSSTPFVNNNHSSPTNNSTPIIPKEEKEGIMENDSKIQNGENSKIITNNGSNHPKIEDSTPKENNTLNTKNEPTTETITNSEIENNNFSSNDSKMEKINSPPKENLESKEENQTKHQNEHFRHSHTENQKNIDLKLFNKDNKISPRKTSSSNQGETFEDSNLVESNEKIQKMENTPTRRATIKKDNLPINYEQDKEKKISPRKLSPRNEIQPAVACATLNTLAVTEPTDLIKKRSLVVKKSIYFGTELPPILSENDPSQNEKWSTYHEKRTNIVKEIYESEKTYNEYLQTMIKVFFFFKIK